MTVVVYCCCDSSEVRLRTVGRTVGRASGRCSAAQRPSSSKVKVANATVAGGIQAETSHTEVSA